MRAHSGRGVCSSRTKRIFTWALPGALALVAGVAVLAGERAAGDETDDGVVPAIVVPPKKSKGWKQTSKESPIRLTRVVSPTAIAGTVIGQPQSQTVTVQGPFKDGTSTADTNKLATLGPSFLTNSTTLYFKVTLPTDPASGSLSAEFDIASPVSITRPSNTANPVQITVDATTIQNRGKANITFAWQPGLDANGASPPVIRSTATLITVDTRGPQFYSVDLTSDDTGTPIVLVRLQESDVDSNNIDGTTFDIKQLPPTKDSLKYNFIGIDDGNTIKLQLNSGLTTGIYQITAVAPGAGVKNLRDLALNAAGANGSTVTPQIAQFNSFPSPTTGPHREFPRFLPPKNDDDTQPYNPGAHVETRVAQLYYRRDAHRVAQIINRNVKSYAQAAVTKAQRNAEDLRDTAEQATDDRQAKERAAIRAAQKTREAEHQLANARAALDAARTNALQVAQQQAQAAANQPAGTTQPPASTTAQTQANALVTAAVQQVNDLEQKVANLRDTERNAAEDSAVAEAKETRAREKQFRAEVAAASADPDTYAPANMQSADPVSQVSISVIGEGQIQLRGPIAGINEIRMMINQMDSPLGQVKVGIHTVQINGEHEDRMEKVASRIEGYIDVSRFQTSQCLMLLRRAIVEEAAQIAEMAEMQGQGHRQIDRDRKYLYSFFGRDFIDELYAMDSEFLHSGNKLLSLHAMDSISLSKALFVLALAKNDIRQRILAHFDQLIMSELPQAEYDFRQANKVLKCCKESKFKCVARRACEQYKFRSFRGYFELQIAGSDTMTPMQREFIRLAQIFKSQMVAEVELKQRIVERGLIQDAANDQPERAALLRSLHNNALATEMKAIGNVATATEVATQSQQRLRPAIEAALAARAALDAFGAFRHAMDQNIRELNTRIERADANQNVSFDIEGHSIALSSDPKTGKLRFKGVAEYYKWFLNRQFQKDAALRNAYDLSDTEEMALARFEQELKAPLDAATKAAASDKGDVQIKLWNQLVKSPPSYDLLYSVSEPRAPFEPIVIQQLNGIEAMQVARSANDWARQLAAYQKLVEMLTEGGWKSEIVKLAETVRESVRAAYLAVKAQDQAKVVSHATRAPLDHRKILDFLIDEQTEKYIDLVEASRSHIAAFDNHIKRLITALEDDFKVQFYDPAFVSVRTASCEWDVTFGQIERTTILTNNRALGKVSPQASMEFDLPKRDLMIVEAMNGAKALVDEYGNLLQDPTFLGLTGMLSGSPAVGGTSLGNPVPGLPGQGLATPAVRNILPGLSTDSQEKLLAEPTSSERKFGSALDKLVPDPAVYKFETGTNLELKPVIQPDGDAVVYDFDYMYRTNVREPVRADEKHLGRVKEHYIHTQVQTSTFELREISRYVVALKAARTARGVPLFEDMPGLGILFRPLPSADSSLQQNIILGQSVVYPTLFDLMGLRWAPSAVDLDHVSLRDTEHVVRGRQKTIKDFTFDEASRNVDGFLDIKSKTPNFDRRDLYHRQSLPSPYHPGGFVASGVPEDPTRNRYIVPDSRPEEFRDPAYDELHRREIEPEDVRPGVTRPTLPTRVPSSAPRSGIAPDIELNVIPQPESDGEEIKAPAMPQGRRSPRRYRDSAVQSAAYTERPASPAVRSSPAGGPKPKQPAAKKRPIRGDGDESTGGQSKTAPPRKQSFIDKLLHRPPRDGT